ncbi:MAG: hypothetical protein JW860_07845, partial [Sedimentisphaerales bacterium]|nr:hypothetical protein [Sedimentisphaerales bacterium]
DAVCFGSLCQRMQVSRVTVRKFLQATRPDCLRLFDINLRQSYYCKEIIHDMLNISNILKLNDDELRLVADLLDIKGGESGILSELAQRYHLELIALTRGADGSVLYTTDQTSTCSGFKPADIVDTVGAGDAFTAAIAIGRLRSHDLDQINEHANRVAAYVCTQPGATPRLPHELR